MGGSRHESSRNQGCLFWCVGLYHNWAKGFNLRLRGGRTKTSWSGKAMKIPRSKKESNVKLKTRLTNQGWTRGKTGGCRDSLKGGKKNLKQNITGKETGPREYCRR